MKKILLSLVMLGSASLSQAQYFSIPFLNAGKNPGGVNADGENPYPSAANVGWSNVWNGDATATPTYATEQTLPFSFKFNGSAVTKYTPSNFGTISFDAGTPTVKPSAFSNLALPSANIPDNSVCVLGMQPKSVVSGTTTYQSAVMTKTYGKAPFRQQWVWFNFFGEANIQNGWTYWAIVMEETTNNIYVVDMKTLCVTTAGALCTSNVKMSVGIQTNGTTSYNLSASPNVGAQQITANIFTAEDNSYYQFIQGSQPTNDLSGKSGSMSQFLVLSSAPFSVSGSFFNIGTAKTTSADLNYSVNGGAVVTGAASGANIATFGSQDLAHPTKWTPSAVGVYTIKYWASKINGSSDENMVNDTITMVVNVVDKIIPRKILHEVFTSSTCGPCTAGNVKFEGIVATKSSHSTVKYQMSWPSTGDPYYTAEGGVRRTYYGVNSIPMMFVDGGWGGNASSYTDALYDQFAAKPAFMEIKGNVSLTWKNKITANVDITPVANFSSTNMKLFATIVEGTTYKNKKTNGETQFENVVKKIMPDGNGLALAAMTKDTKVSKTLSFTFNGGYRLPGDATSPINLGTENSIETWDDLSVVVWVQDAVTKEVLQTETFPIALVGVEAVEQNLMLYPNPANSVFNVDAPEMGNSMVSVMDVQGKVVFAGAMESGKLSLNVADWSEGVYVVKVSGNSKTLNSKIVVRH